MRPTEILMQEHRVIEQVLDCLEQMALQVETGSTIDADSANQACDFFRNFADRCHHGKEEDCLFPLLEEKGFSREQGPTGVMLREHDEGRRHIRGIAAAVEAGETSEFISHVRVYVQLLREHIQKEDHCLFQMTDQTLSETEQSDLMESFASVERDDMGPGTHEKYLGVAAELAKRFGVPCRVSQAAPGGSSCSHQ